MEGREGSLRIPVDAGPSLQPLVLSLHPTFPSSPWETPGVQLEAAEVLTAALPLGARGALMAPDCCGPVDISAKVLAVPWQALALQQSPSPSPQPCLMLALQSQHGINCWSVYQKRD